MQQSTGSFATSTGSFGGAFSSSLHKYGSARSHEHGGGRKRGGGTPMPATTAMGGSALSPPTHHASSRHHEPWMVSASEREVAAVASGSGTHERISKAAVIESLRVATASLDQAMAASVQSAALSALPTEGDKGGETCSREEVARVWLTNVLPALERAPLRTMSGGLGTRRFTDRVQRVLHTKLSQAMLDELPAAQEALGLSADATGGGALPLPLVQPFVAHLASAALRSAVDHLGDGLLALPGLEGLHPRTTGGDAAAFGGGLDGIGGEGPLEPDGALSAALAALHSPTGGGTASAFSASADGAPFVSQADALGAAEGLLREAQATALRLSDENEALVHESNRMLDVQAELTRERDAAAEAARPLEADARTARLEAAASLERASQAEAELRASRAQVLKLEADLAELRGSVKAQVVAAVEASQEAARRAYEADMRHDRASLEREVATLRAAKAAEAAAGAELQKRCERLSAEKYDLEREKGALLAERAASSTKYQAASLAVLSVPGSPRGADSPLESPRTREVDDMEARLAAAGLRPGSPTSPRRSLTPRGTGGADADAGGMQSPTGAAAAPAYAAPQYVNQHEVRL